MELLQKEKMSCYYPDTEFVRVPHCSEVPAPVFTSLPDLVSNDELSEATE